MPAHPLTNYKIIEYFKDEPRFNGVFSRNNLPKAIKKEAYVIILDFYQNSGTHWISLFVKSNEVIYFDSFGVDHISEEIKKLLRIKTSSQVSLEFRITTQ